MMASLRFKIFNIYVYQYFHVFCIIFPYLCICISIFVYLYAERRAGMKGVDYTKAGGEVEGV